ncbi:MAG: T9SS type A sorting domain-containing protein, partial [Schleiferiaceae bacterium]|nr:T9SS type A sorting domain-containing protein [Schleiferiaceae bacterium]
GSTSDDATDVTGSLVNVTMKPDYRTSCEIKEHYKTQTLADILLLQATDKSGGAYDMLELAFADHYTNGIDAGLDIAKQGVAQGTQPLIFTSIDNTALVINKMHWPNEGTSVPMGFYAKEDNHAYEIAMVKHPGIYTVYLEDLKTGTWTDLTRHSYSFTNDVKYNLHRFRIHFKLGSASISDFHPGIRAWSMSEGIKVQFHNLITDNARIRITDAVGRVLFDQSRITTREDFIYPTAHLSKGLYTVTVITAENTITEKIIH